MNREEKLRLNKEKRIEKFLILENLRELKGVKYSKMAKDLDMTPVMFSNWKSGKSMPNGEKIEKISNYFGVPSKIFY